MAGIRLYEEQLRILTPHTYVALEKMVMAMAGVANNAGKKTWLGRDKGQEAYSKFLHSLKVVMQALILDGVTMESTPTNDVLANIGIRLEKFILAFPNWQDAYGFGNHFFNIDRAGALAVMERLRGMP